MSDLILESDLEAKRLIRYSDEKIGDLIGKSRQAVNKGLKNTHYFSRTEWIAIVNDLVEIGHPKLPEIQAYLKRLNIKIVGTGSQNSIQPVDLSSIEVAFLEAVIPNPQLFRQHYPSCFAATIDVFVRAAPPANKPGRNEVHVGAPAGALLIGRAMHDAATERDLEIKQWPNAFRLSDPSQYPVLFRVKSKSEGEPDRLRYLTCITDRFVELDAVMIEEVFDAAQANTLPDSKITVIPREMTDTLAKIS